MAKKTVAQLDVEMQEQFAVINANMTKLVDIVQTMATAQVKTNKKAQAAKKQDKPLVAACPDYATDAQRNEYDKLAERARKQYKDACKLFGTESLSVFIPVPKEQDRMPHSIKWTATYSK